MQYNPGKFATLYQAEIGQRLWKFLTKQENIDRLVTASELRKTAVEGVAEPLLVEFGEAVLDNRTKQMIGHMVRQIMEQRDWVLDRSNVTVRTVPFIKASRYRRPDWEPLYAFRNTRDSDDIAITGRRDNPPLPSDAEWVFYTTLDTSLKTAVFLQGYNPADIAQNVREHGFYRVRQRRLLRPAR